jgi:hypothetical protein
VGPVTLAVRVEQVEVAVFCVCHLLLELVAAVVQE